MKYNCILIQSSTFPLPESGYGFIKNTKIYKSDNPLKIAQYIRCTYNKKNIRRYVLNVNSNIIELLIDTIKNKCKNAIFIATLSTSDYIRQIAPSNLYFSITNNEYFFNQCIRFSAAARLNSYLIYQGIGSYYNELVQVAMNANVNIINIDNVLPSEWDILSPLISTSQLILISASDVNSQKFITSKINNNYSGRIFFIELPPLASNVVSNFNIKTNIFTFYPQCPFVYPIDSIINNTIKLSVWEYIPFSWQANIMLCNNINNILNMISTELIKNNQTDYGLSSMKILLS